jgi:hypothetical protein
VSEPMMMDPVDGNAIAGFLFHAFGGEMTDTRGVCSNCGTCCQIAELRVYMKAPSAVARCRFCDHVVMVLGDLGQIIRIDLGGLAAFEVAK